MLSIVRASKALIAQFAFNAVNAIGVLLAVIYNSQTPDLYPNNSHHKIGWIVTSITVFQVFIHLAGRYCSALSERSQRSANDSGIPRSLSCMNYWQRIPTQSQAGEEYRLSNDSGQGTEPGTESLRSNSVSTTDSDDVPLTDREKALDDGELEPGFIYSIGVPLLSARTVAKKFTHVISSRLWTYLGFVYRIIDRGILPIGSVALATGVITFGRFFVSFLSLLVK